MRRRPTAPVPSALFATALMLALAACHAGGSEGAAVPGDRTDQHPFAEVGPDERLQFTGTEPFWGGEVAGGQLHFKTPDRPDGQAVAVSRFAGRGGLSFNGMLDGAAFTMAVTAGSCSDGMTERVYPYVVTLQRGDAAQTGCGWTDRHPFTGPAAP